MDSDLAVAPHDADLRALLESGGAPSRDRDQQTAAGLRVAQQELLGFTEAAPFDLVAKRGVVAPAAVRKQVSLGKVAGSLHERHR